MHKQLSYNYTEGQTASDNSALIERMAHLGARYVAVHQRSGPCQAGTVGSRVDGNLFQKIKFVSPPEKLANGTCTHRFWLLLNQNEVGDILCECLETQA